jgi:hypothetical protein
MLRRIFCALLVDAGRRLIWITPCKRSAARRRDAMHGVSTAVAAAGRPQDVNVVPTVAGFA